MPFDKYLSRKVEALAALLVEAHPMGPYIAAPSTTSSKKFLISLLSSLK
jgi:hypothetical protein